MALDKYADRVETFKFPESGLGELILETAAYIKAKQGLGYTLDSAAVEYRRGLGGTHVFVFPDSAWTVE